MSRVLVDQTAKRCRVHTAGRVQVGQSGDSCCCGCIPDNCWGDKWNSTFVNSLKTDTLDGVTVADPDVNLTFGTITGGTYEGDIKLPVTHWPGGTPTAGYALLPFTLTITPNASATGITLKTFSLYSAVDGCGFAADVFGEAYTHTDVDTSEGGRNQYNYTFNGNLAGYSPVTVTLTLGSIDTSGLSDITLETLALNADYWKRIAISFGLGINNSTGAITASLAAYIIQQARVIYRFRRTSVSPNWADEDGYFQFLIDTTGLNLAPIVVADDVDFGTSQPFESTFSDLSLTLIAGGNVTGSGGFLSGAVSGGDLIFDDTGSGTLPDAMVIGAGDVEIVQTASDDPSRLNLPALFDVTDLITEEVSHFTRACVEVCGVTVSDRYWKYNTTIFSEVGPGLWATQTNYTWASNPGEWTPTEYPHDDIGDYYAAEIVQGDCSGCPPAYSASFIDAGFPDDPITIWINQDADDCVWRGYLLRTEESIEYRYNASIVQSGGRWVATLTKTRTSDEALISTNHFSAPIGCADCLPLAGWVYDDGEPDAATVELTEIPVSDGGSASSVPTDISDGGSASSVPTDISDGGHA